MDKQSFEGQKVFHCKDGKVRIFNDKMNHIRMSRGAERMGMPTMPAEMFHLGPDPCNQSQLGFCPAIWKWCFPIPQALHGG